MLHGGRGDLGACASSREPGVGSVDLELDFRRAVALVVGAVSSSILSTLNVAVLTADTLSMRSVARYSTL